LPLFESILRLFRRPAKPIDTFFGSEAHARVAREIEERREAADAEAMAKLAEEPDLALLLANGRAAAERQQQILGDPTAPPAKPQPTKFTARCQFCLEPFDHEPRTPHQLEPLRQVLLIPGHAATAPIDICDPCYENVLASAIPVNGHTGQLDIGGDNHGPGNVLLRTFGKPAA